MKKKIIALILLSSFSAFGSHFPPKEELAANYQKCMDSDESWYRRWGQYLVSFDIYEAYQICRSVYQNADVDMMGCRIHHQWYNAGYLCDFEH
jgi:hypothetical protein